MSVYSILKSMYSNKVYIQDAYFKSQDMDLMRYQFCIYTRTQGKKFSKAYSSFSSWGHLMETRDNKMPPK